MRHQKTNEKVKRVFEFVGTMRGDFLYNGMSTSSNTKKLSRTEANQTITQFVKNEYSSNTVTMLNKFFPKTQTLDDYAEIILADGKSVLY